MIYKSPLFTLLLSLTVNLVILFSFVAFSLSLAFHIFLVKSSDGDLEKRYHEDPVILKIKEWHHYTAEQTKNRAAIVCHKIFRIDLSKSNSD